MTPNTGVTDDQLGQFTRRMSAIASRLEKSLNFDGVMDTLQSIHDGEVVTTSPVPSYNPKTGRYRFEVNYDESILEKIGEIQHVTDEMFPDHRKGKRIVKGQIVITPCRMKPDELSQWASDRGQILARPKELADLSLTFPLPILTEYRYITAVGQFHDDVGYGRSYLTLNHGAPSYPHGPYARWISCRWLSVQGPMGKEDFSKSSWILLLDE